MTNPQIIIPVLVSLSSLFWFVFYRIAWFHQKVYFSLSCQMIKWQKHNLLWTKHVFVCCKRAKEVVVIRLNGYIITRDKDSKCNKETKVMLTFSVTLPPLAHNTVLLLSVIVFSLIMLLDTSLWKKWLNKSINKTNCSYALFHHSAGYALLLLAHHTLCSPVRN